jgi:hypothetical protein
MDETRTATATTVTTADTGAVLGPGTARLGTGAVIIWNDMADEGRDQFYRWHDHEHIPERLSIPGFLRGRRYGKRGHAPEYLTLYEADELGVLASPAYLARLNAPTPLTQDTIRHFRNTSRAVCRVAYSVGSSNGGHILTLRIEVADDKAAAFRAFAIDAFDRVLALNGIVACHLYQADQSASRVNTAESAKRAFDVPSWVVLVEATLAASAEAARALIEGPELAALAATVRPDAAVYALEICRLSQPATSN